MKFLIAFITFVAMAYIVIGQQTDAGSASMDCNKTYPITQKETDDILTYKFDINSTNQRSFFHCLMTKTGACDSSGNLSPVVLRGNGDATFSTKVDTAVKGCTSKQTDPKTKVWELSVCFFDAMTKQ